MGKTKRMDQVKIIIQTYLETQSIRATARRLEVSRNTVKGYIRRGEDHNTDLSALLLLSESELSDIFYLPDKPDNKESSHRKAVFTAKVDYWLQELHNPPRGNHLPMPF